MNRSLALLLLLVAWVLVAAACAHRVRREVTAPSAVETLDGKAPYLKAHMLDGRLYILSDWSVDSIGQQVRGSGRRFAPDRGIADSGQHLVRLDSVALFETNAVHVSGSVAPLALMTGISVGVTVYCAANPKACFGSCPTFYAFDGERELLQAEGFSSSVAPSLEARDIDALYRARPPAGRRVDVRMRNEALETHVVRSVDLLAVRRVPGHRVFVDGASTFWSTTAPVAPVACAAAEGDCLPTVRAYDGVERYTRADSSDLAAREDLELTFAPTASGPQALVISSRQSLLPTFLLYQMFAYMGRSVGEWLATFERSDAATRGQADQLVATLGGIDVLVRHADGTWMTVETVRETGPLASDTRLIHLPAISDSQRIRLRMAKGAWRIDYVALVTVDGPVVPLRTRPRDVTTPEGRDAAARRRLLDSTQVLVTMPGDEYTLTFELPESARGYELFLESRGYYLEWMREEWMVEEDRLAAARMFIDPAGALRALAPRFAAIEPALETAFWSSKYVRP